jgi:hypothetical protein
MATRREDETFEARIEYTTAKAHLVELTLGGKYWLPKSQIVHMDEPDIDGNRVFQVTGWWWENKREVD